MARQPFITCEELRELMADTDVGIPDIMAEYGVARATVYNRIHACGLERYIEPRHWAREEFDWDVRGEHAKDHHLKMLRYAARKRRGVQLRPEIEREVDNWTAARLAEGVVVTYHPGRGFGFSPKQPGDQWLWRPGHYGRPVRKPPRKPASRRRTDRDEE